jgi:MinD superfamily P-loop ATPase
MAQRRRPTPAQPTWQWREVPVLNETTCTGCGLCCVLCPTDCLAMNGPIPWMPRPGECIGCGVCALICPATALEMQVPAISE